MATFATRRAELLAALASGSIAAGDDPGALAPPCVLVFGAGSDMDGLGRGQITVGYRLTLLAGYSDAPAASAELATLAAAVIAVVRALAGWAVGALSPDQIRTVGGGDYLSADLLLSTTIDL